MKIQQISMGKNHVDIGIDVDRLMCEEQKDATHVNEMKMINYRGMNTK